MKIVPLEINDEEDGGWGQYVILEYKGKSPQKLEKSVSSFLEEGNLKEDNDKNCNKFCTIC